MKRLTEEDKNKILESLKAIEDIIKDDPKEETSSTESKTITSRK